MKLNKFFLIGAAALGMGITSCVGDLDLKPIDPNKTYEDPESLEFMQSALAECYSALISGPTGPGSSIVSGADAGFTSYVRALFNMNVFGTDETFWIWWNDLGVPDLVQDTYAADNTLIYAGYSALFAHIAICNQFISQVPDGASQELLQMRDEARALRALSYYWALDLFGNPTFTVDAPDGVTAPNQTTRAELYAWMEQELTELVDNSYLASTPIYGRVGKDGAEALLARLYLNAGVYTGTPAWDKCAQRCANIISRHQGTGFQGSGLVDNYHAVFSRDNHQYAPGGGGVNEVLWCIPGDSEHCQTYGGAFFLLASELSNNYGMTPEYYGSGAQWGCLKARGQLTERFMDEANPQNDDRFNRWIGGDVTYESDGEQKEVTYSVHNTVAGDWLAGYTVIKWTNLGLINGEVDWGNTLGLDCPSFSSCDFAVFRLSDIYLMYAECALNGASSANSATAKTYVQYIRNRAGLYDSFDLTMDFLQDERSRELYWELTRRSDLIRWGKWTGTNQAVWDWKGGVAEGTNISDRYNLLPIPTNVLAAQPYFQQNPGY